MATDTQNQLLGPEIVGMRITVYNLLPYFLDPTATEERICRSYNLTREQVAAARAYVLNNVDEVFAVHREIEARIAAGNPPEVNEQMERTHQRLLKFREWMDERDDASERASSHGIAAGERAGFDPFPTFEQWLIRKGSRPVEES